jgi:Ca2+-binding RTX toxin-like protein
MAILIPTVTTTPRILTPSHILVNPSDPIVFGTPIVVDPITEVILDSGVDAIDGSSADESFHGWLIDEDTTDNTDLLLGNGGNDFLYGDGGNDAVYGGTGNDYIEGGFGSDGGRIIGTAANGQFVRLDNVQVAYASTNYVTGLFGGAGNDIIYGGAGDDALFGDEDNDLLFGEDDSDWLDGGDGGDQLNGGAANDILFGQSGLDLLLGEDGSDSLFGGAGDDTLFGGAGVDRLLGGLESDILWGGDGRDELQGEGGNDILIGGLGVDALGGGAGVDRFRFTAIEELGDVIQNFSDTDFIEIVRSVTKLGKLLPKGTLKSKFLDIGRDNKAGDADDFFVYRTGDDTLWFDKDGNGAGFSSIKVVTLQNDFLLSASDIIIL